MSFLGPKTADAAYRTGYDAVLSALGYRLRVTEAAWRRVPGGTELTVTLANEGSAPFYWDWPVNLYAETAEDAWGYAQRYWVSVDTGLLVVAERLQKGETVYRMAALEADQTAPPAETFTLPDGTDLLHR